MGKQGFVRSIPKTKRPALLQTAVTLLLHAGFAGRMAHMGSAHLMGAILVLSKVVCATGTAPKRSAWYTIALLPPKQANCVPDMAAHTVAGRRSSRAQWRDAPPPLIVGASAGNTAAARVNVGLQAAAMGCTASQRPAPRTAAVASASTHQNGSHKQTNKQDHASNKVRHKLLQAHHQDVEKENRLERAR